MPTPTTTDSNPTRKLALAALGLAVIGGLITASAVAVTGGRAAAGDLTAGSVDVLADDAVPDSVLVTRALLKSSPAAVVVAHDAAPPVREEAAELGRTHGVPVFAVGADQATVVDDELRRLGVRTVVRVGDVVPGLAAAQTTDPAVLQAGVRPAPGRPVVLVSEDAVEAAAAAEIAGADVVPVPVPDPRANGRAVAALKRDDDPAVRAVGARFGTREEFADRVELARTVPELPGGGQLMFPGRMVVALYGSPGSDALGPLGRQPLPATIARAEEVAAPYRKLSAVPVIPGFEIIVTVASAEPSYRGAYTNILDPERFVPWIDAAEKAGVYVTIDLQPGRMDFLTQAKMYQKLLERPHVGLALDPEWRLKPDQVHLKQIGAVDPAEVNRVADWLAGIVRAKKLPQKAFVLHQFDADMLGDRSKLDTSHPELAVVLHADGHGTPPVKMGTWNRMVTGLPPNVWMGWKNFYKEDKPMFGPAQTMDVRPRPYFVSYQ